MVKNGLIKRMALIASVMAFVVIGLGSFTRLIDAGLGCPDWPGCYGQLIVSAKIAAAHTDFTPYKAWAEMVHRYFVAGLSCLIISLIIVIISKARNQFNLTLAGLLMTVLIYQILLGQWTVTMQLLPIVVTQHLLGGYLILSFLWLFYLGHSPIVIANDQLISGVKKSLPWAYLAVILLFLQISLGAWTSTNYAALSCPDFPFCKNDLALSWYRLQEVFTFSHVDKINYAGGVLDTSVRQLIQTLHRLGALIISCYLFIWASLTLRSCITNKVLTKNLFVVIFLLITQIGLGIINVLFKLPLHSAIAHTLVAVLLLLSMITFIYRLSTQGVNHV